MRTAGVGSRARGRDRVGGPEAPLAFVIGDMDLVRPLGLAGIRCVTVSHEGEPPWFSRFCVGRVAWGDAQAEPEALVGRLESFGLAQEAAPVLFYEEDADLLLVSRFRARLRAAFRFVLPRAELVEDLVDKQRFSALADRLGLPVPRSRSLREVASADATGLRFPVIVKPHTRHARPWAEVAPPGPAGQPKVLTASDEAALGRLWPRLVGAGGGFVLQELIEGPESRIESYHAYVDEEGATVAEFTGRKIRTFPAEHGYTTSLETTDRADVARAGREVLERLELRGVAKVDFKRDPQGRLALLEINPRFNLWHHAGARAGVNVPALVYGDLVGRPRPGAVRARPGVRWCRLQEDVRAARRGGASPVEWVRQLAVSEARATLAWDDPCPFVRGVLWPRARAGWARLRAAA
jgi:D-aspartate ligase